MNPLIPTLSLQVTFQCNCECKHCGPCCGPKEKDWMAVSEIRDLIVQAGEGGAYNVVFTGGEPTLLGRDLNVLLEFIRDETPIKSTRMVTNGMWASSYEQAHRMLKGWQDSGLAELNVSCGEYHQEFVPIQNVANAYRAARDLDYVTVLLAGEFLAEGKGRWSPQMFRDAVGENLMPAMEVSPFVAECHGITCGSAMAYGRGKKYVREDEMIYRNEAEIPSLCSDVLQAITVQPNGTTSACCGVMTRDESLLNIGNWREQRLRPMVEASRADLVLNWVRYIGLKDMKAWVMKKDSGLRFPDKFVSTCDLCAQLLYNPRVQELLLQDGGEREADIVANKVAQDASDLGPGGYGPPSAERSAPYGTVPVPRVGEVTHGGAL